MKRINLRTDRVKDVSEAMRNLAMDHAPNSDTFAKNYLSRNCMSDLKP